MPTDCAFEIESPGVFRCTVCGWQYRGPAAPRRNCPGVPDVGIVQKGIHYVKAVAGWGLSGMPVRSDEEVARIFAEHCRPCKHFDLAHGTCTVCGCCVTESGPALRNKIKMASERCPAGKW